MPEGIQKQTEILEPSLIYLEALHDYTKSTTTYCTCPEIDQVSFAAIISRSSSIFSR